MGYSAVALTDINNLYGAIRFYNSARDAGVKPIMGCELRHAATRAFLLAKDIQGYANLCRIITRRHLEEFSPVAAIGELHAGLHVITEETDLARELAPRMDRRYLWLMLAWPGRGANHLRRIVGCAEELGLGLVATPDIYFLDKEEYEVHRVLAAIRENDIVPRLDPAALAHPESFLPPPRALEAIFDRFPDALRNNSRIAEECTLEIPTGKPIFPRFPLPEGRSATEFLRDLCLDGVRRRYGGPCPAAMERLERELRVIQRLGFTEYFIFVWDILSHARERGIPTLGRGSGASSIVSYLLGITNVDPLEYNIPFERFLHLKRTDCPDLDIDLCWIRREEVIESIYRKYGPSRVAMVSTHGTFGPRGAIREVAKALGVPNGIVNRIARRLPHYPDAGVEETIRNSLGHLSDERLIRDLIRLAEKIRGSPWHLNVHCGGLVMADRPLDNYVPLERAAKGIVITQYDKDAIEAIGLVKMDFLGNHGLTVRDEAIAWARRRGATGLSADNIPDADPLTRQTLARGATIGCCQLESPAMRNLLQMLRPSCIKEVMQALALIRPGPASLGTKEAFVRRARGLEPPSFPHPSLREVLGDSHGIMLYEDDAMLVASALAGISLEEGDRIRKAISRERTGEGLRRLSREFLERAVANGVAREVAEEMWAQMAKFTSYSFCKAHAASYGILAYQLAYLKAHYPLEFMTAVLNHQWGMYPKRVHLEEAKRLGIEVLLPCVNRSRRDFTIEEGRIRVGLDQVKGLSTATVEAIVEQRRVRPFESPADLIARIRPAEKEVENLVLCGAFDFTGRIRPELIWETKVASRLARKRTGQPPTWPGLACPPALRDYSPEQKVRHELEILGLSVTCHPLELIRPHLATLGIVESRDLPRLVGKRVLAAGILAAVREAETRTGKMHFITLEDEWGIFEAVLLPDACAGNRPSLDDAGPYLVSGIVEERYDAITLHARRVARLQCALSVPVADNSASTTPGPRPSRPAACAASEAR